MICYAELIRLKIKSFVSYGNVKVSLHCRPYLADIVKHHNPDYLVNKIEDNECLFINGRIIAPENLCRAFTAYSQLKIKFL